MSSIASFAPPPPPPRAALGRCLSCCANVCASCAAECHSGHCIVELHQGNEVCKCGAGIACALHGSPEHMLVAAREQEQTPQYAAAVACLELLFLLSEREAVSLPAASNDIGFVSLSLALSLADISSSPPLQQHMVLRHVLRCDLFSSSRVNGTSADIGLFHSRAPEVVCLALPHARALLRSRSPLPSSSIALHQCVLAVLAHSRTFQLWDPRQARISLPTLCNDSSLSESLNGFPILSPPLFPPSSAIASHERQALFVCLKACIAGDFTRLQQLPPAPAPSDSLPTQVKLWGMSPTVDATPRHISCVKDFATAVKACLVEADASPFGSLVALHAQERAGILPLLFLSSSSQGVAIDLEECALQLLDQLRFIREGLGEVAEEEFPHVAAVIFPLFPLLSSPRIVKIFFDVVQFRALFEGVVLHPVNLFDLRSVLQSFGFAERDSAAALASLSALSCAMGLADAGEARGFNPSVSSVAHLARLSNTVCALLFETEANLLHATGAGWSTLLTSLSSMLATARFSLHNLLVSLSDSSCSIVAHRALLLSQLSALQKVPAREAARMKRLRPKAGKEQPTRVAPALPTLVLSPWYLKCSACGLAAGHFTPDCPRSPFFGKN
jgi:hypothetical protein